MATYLDLVHEFKNKPKSINCIKHMDNVSLSPYLTAPSGGLCEYTNHTVENPTALTRFLLWVIYMGKFFVSTKLTINRNDRLEMRQFDLTQRNRWRDN